MLDLFIASAHAQQAGAAQPNALMQMAPLVFVFIIFYFLMIKPQKKKMVEEQNMLGALSKGDEIYTKSGMLGTITGMTEKVITVEIADGIKVKVLKGQIGGLASKIFESKENAKK